MTGEAMSKRSLAPRFIILIIYAVSTLYIHLRGKRRYRFSRQLTDHSTFVAPYNALIYLFSAVPNKPVLATQELPELLKLRENWETIRDEAAALYDGGHIRVAEKHNDLAFNTFFKNGWTRFYLKWYDDFLPSAEKLCPKTVELVRSIPSIHAALFVALQPRSRLGEHRDPFAGSLRYHLGLMTPNSDDCRIYIDGEPHSWRDGQDILFDETFLHHVVNDTDQPRIILFCDVERPLKTPVIQALNRFTAKHVVKATAAQNLPSERIGFANRLSAFIHSAKEFFTRLKAWNQTLYYIVKHGINALLAFFFLVMPIVRRFRQRRGSAN